MTDVREFIIINAIFYTETDEILSSHADSISHEFA